MAFSFVYRLHERVGCLWGGGWVVSLGVMLGGVGSMIVDTGRS
jgi:hypothetical protein